MKSFLKKYISQVLMVTGLIFLTAYQTKAEQIDSTLYVNKDTSKVTVYAWQIDEAILSMIELDQIRIELYNSLLINENLITLNNIGNDNLNSCKLIVENKNNEIDLSIDYNKKNIEKLRKSNKKDKVKSFVTGLSIGITTTLTLIIFL